VPTQKFLAAAELWNTTKTRGTLEVTADPAKAKNVSGLTEVDLAKGTRAKQLGEVSLAGKPMVKLETLDQSGVGTGKQYYVYVVDLKDVQNGSATAKIATPKVIINAQPIGLFSNPERTLKVKDLPANSRMVDNGAFPLETSRDHDRIARLAHSFWEQRGGKDGSQDGDWFRAEAVFKSSHGVKLADGPDVDKTGYVNHALTTPE